MKTYLHKLPEGFIVTSDEEPASGDLAMHPNGTIGIIETALAIALFKETNEGSFVENCKKIIAQQDQIDFSSLSEDEQKKIGWFDAENLADNCVITNPANRTINEDGWMSTGFVYGFQKAQELLSDKKFTEEDMKNAYRTGRYGGATQTFYEFEDFIQSLSKTSWEIEIEMENDYEEPFGDFQKPKFINGKIKVLKIK